MASVSPYFELQGPDSTRVLKLAPRVRNRNGVLVGRLVEMKLNNPPKFEAISYVWGNFINQGKILCSSKACKTRKEIRFTANGENALRRMQYTLTERLIWIDAICIDQSNLSERNHQVSIMAKIYAAAQQVLVWLPSGDGWPLEIYDYDPEVLRESLDSKPEYLLEYPELVRIDLEYLNSSRWFSRVWTLLEYAFAKKVLFFLGNTAPLDGEKLSSKYELKRESPLYYESAHSYSRKLVHLSQVSAISVLFQTCRNKKATLGVDKVFSILPMLSLWPELGQYFVPADYSKAEEVVFRETTIALMLSTRDLRVLMMVPGVHESQVFQSWVVDFNTPSRRAMAWPEGNISNSAVVTSLKAFPVSRVQHGLCLCGKIVDTVLAVASNKLDKNSPNMGTRLAYSYEFAVPDKERMFEAVLDWLYLAMSIKQSPQQNAFRFFSSCFRGSRLSLWGLPIVLAELLLCLVQPSEISSACGYIHPFNMWQSNYFCPLLSISENQRECELDISSSAQRLGSLKDICSYFGTPLSKHSHDSYDASDLVKLAEGRGWENVSLDVDNDIVSHFSQHEHEMACDNALIEISEVLSDREFFITHNGYVGVTNGHIREGDLVVLIPELHRPVILRKEPSMNEHRFVGGADIAGMMPKSWPDWEEYGDTIWDEAELDDHNLEEFKLI
jgi:Heterokaryon incompatibility protein (HET)